MTHHDAPCNGLGIRKLLLHSTNNHFQPKGEQQATISHDSGADAFHPFVMMAQKYYSCICILISLSACMALRVSVLFPTHTRKHTLAFASTSGEDPPSRRRLKTLEDTESWNLKPIGTVQSIYKLCVGTPRQGLLVPAARGCISLEALREAEVCVQGLEGFSHVWILFMFHLNTVGQSTRYTIAPPALGNDKIGVLATRSPHRFNPIGMTLAKLEGIRTVKEFVPGRKKTVRRTYLDLSGIDLVDGTPVVDIKPYVPVYDAPPEDAVVPDWVSSGLSAQRKVEFTDDAIDDLQAIMNHNAKALKFYNDSSKVLECIHQVLARDVRSPFQRRKAVQGQSQAQRSQRLSERPSTSSSTQQIDNLLISFACEDDKVTVTCISLLEDLKNVNE